MCLFIELLYKWNIRLQPFFICLYWRLYEFYLLLFAFYPLLLTFLRALY